jgi:uncharacterized membrane protein YbhN (UPF0104 family)
VTEPAAGAHERHLFSHVFNIAVFVVGGVALAFLMRSLGLANARRVFADVGPWLAVIVGLDVAAMACDAGAIHAFMQPEARMVSYIRVLAAQASGRAINVLTPGGALGEATKVAMLVGHAPQARIVSAIVQYNLVTLYLSVAVLIIGVPLTAALVDLPPRVAIVAWGGLAVVVAVVIALAVIIRRGAAATLLAAARGIRVLSAARVQAWTARLVDLDHQLRDLHDNRSPGTARGIALLVASRLCSWAATTTVLVGVGVPISATLLVGVFSVGILIGWVASIVPLGIGIADGGNYALFGVLGATGAHGVLVTMLGRARSLIVALIGLAMMAAAHTATRVALARRRLRRQDGPRYGG